jgi:hypothetical protein
MVRVHTNHGTKSSTHTIHEGKLSPNPMVRVHTNHGTKSSTHTNHEGKLSPEPMVRVYTNHGKKSSTHTNHEGKNHPTPWFVCTRTMERKVQLIRIMKETVTQPHGSCIHDPWKKVQPIRSTKEKTICGASFSH